MENLYISINKHIGVVSQKKYCSTKEQKYRVKQRQTFIYINLEAYKIINSDEVVIKEFDDSILIRPSCIDDINTRKIVQRKQIGYTPKYDFNTGEKLYGEILDDGSLIFYKDKE